jgi:hypothetical protein
MPDIPGGRSPAEGVIGRVRRLAVYCLPACAAVHLKTRGCPRIDVTLVVRRERLTNWNASVTGLAANGLPMPRYAFRPAPQ